MSTSIYCPRDKSIFRRTETTRDLLSLRSQSGKNFLQINPELFVEVLADGANGDVIHSCVNEILDSADTVFDRAASIPYFHALTRKVLEIIGVKESLGLAQGLLPVRVNADAVV